MLDRELSKKERRLLDHAWHKLCECCAENLRPVTAGEFAKHMGVAPSTARRWLADMLENGGIVSFRGIARNRFPKITYEPTGRGETWDYAYGELYNAEERE
jgi:predicted ArsR family transcriptional regulator